jgi:sentrin-specific protease 7
VVDLVEDDDDDDVRVVTPPAPPLLDGTCHDIPLSARSSQSHMSVGSGSTVTGNKPSQPKSEFREADNMLRPHKKPRRQGPNRPQGDRAQSPFAGGTMSGGSVEATKAQDSIVINNHSSGQSASARQTMLQDLQQGGSDGYTMSRHFPNARINESIAARTVSDRPLAGEGTELRKSHRPAPKHADLAADSNSEDELTMKPVDKKVNATSKAARAANSGVKRKDYMKSEGPGWPLIFARSYEYQERDTAFHANTPKLVLRYGTDGWCVKGYDAQENVVTRFDIRSQDVIKAQADDVGRIRLEGPRQEDGNRHIFDLEFAKTHDFQKFRDEFLTNTLLIHGKSQTREQ